MAGGLAGPKKLLRHVRCCCRLLLQDAPFAHVSADTVGQPYTVTTILPGAPVSRRHPPTIAPETRAVCTMVFAYRPPTY
jgi:hypothetical protein